MRRVEMVLEAANLIVHRIDPENDIGRDAWVDIVEGTDVTGGVVALQVKSGSTFFHRDRWVIPGKDEDFTLWRESSVPMFGIVHDPRTDQLRWTDLSGAAISDATSTSDHGSLHQVVEDGPYGMRSVVVPDGNRLDAEVASFVSAAKASIRQRPGLPARELLSDDVDAVRTAIGDSFAMGRRDARAFLLLAALLSRLPMEAHHLAVRALAMATRHPDISWTADNWIPSAVKGQVAAACRWTTDDVSLLLGLVADDENGIQRGSFGQHVYHVLCLDQRLDERLWWVVTDTRRDKDVRDWAAVILLYHAGEDASTVLERLVAQAPDLQRSPFFVEVMYTIDEHGYVSMF